MYSLIFKKNSSKHFQTALDFAKELNCEIKGDFVIINIPEQMIINSYAMIRTLFGYIQNWIGTTATYKGKEVHPYQFILNANRIGECASESIHDKTNCSIQNSITGWSCKKIDNIFYQEGGNGNYKTNGKYWYNYGYFNGPKWMIDKEQIHRKLLKHVISKGIDLCLIFEFENLRHSVSNLPDFIVPDENSYRIHYEEKFVKGEKLLIPNNIRHIKKDPTPHKKSYEKGRERRNTLPLH